jgi:hypothetical protein
MVLDFFFVRLLAFLAEARFLVAGDFFFVEAVFFFTFFLTDFFFLTVTLESLDQVF